MVKTHKMRLSVDSFVGIKKKLQKYETRLLDEKRRLVKVGDCIEFTNRANKAETITVKIKSIIKAESFLKLFTLFDPKEANWPADYTPKQCVDDMLVYYSEEEQEKYGVVTFQIQLI